jgi:hypothetical protein
MHSIEQIKKHAGNKVCPEHKIFPAINVFDEQTVLLFCCGAFRNSVKAHLTAVLGEEYITRNTKFY